MKVKAEKWIMDDCVSYKILELEKCCDKLINSKNIYINKNYDEHGIYDYDNEGDYSVKLFRKEEYSSWDDEFSENYYETINFCPFCGKPIMIDIVNIIDKTDEYKALKSQREELWNKLRKTDSKKKEEALRVQVRELDIKINEMLDSDDFVKEEC